MCALVPGCVTTKVQVLLPLVVVLTYTCDWCWRTVQQASTLNFTSIKYDSFFWLETILRPHLELMLSLSLELRLTNYSTLAKAEAGAVVEAMADKLVPISI